MVRKDLKIASLLLALLTVTFFVMDSAGQTNRRRQTSKANPSATPPSNGEPAVISRADDYPTVVIEPVPTRSDPAAGDSFKSTGSSDTIEDLRERLLRLENNSSRKRNDPDEKQRRLSMNLDILTKSEQRADSLRKQLFEMIEKESSLRGRMDQIDNDMRPEAIERSFATVGSLRPEELRTQRRRSLELEKQNIQALLTEVQKNRANIELNLQRADGLVERLRTRIEKEIDAALAEDETKPEEKEKGKPNQ